MLEWLPWRKRVRELPEYSALRSVPSRGLPRELAEIEESASFVSRRDSFETELQQPPRRPQDDEPLFTELLARQGSGVVTITLDDQRCLPVFSTPFRAADYVRTLLASGPSVRYLSSSPLQLVRMLNDLQVAKIERFALDRCPRCSIFTTVGSSSMKVANDLIVVWSIHKASELARMDLYLSYALESAQAGKLGVARDVALEAVGHVSLEDPRPHLLLAQLATRLRDQTLLREAKAFLRFLKVDRWEERFQQDLRAA